MVLQDLYLHFSQITCLDRVFLVQYHHFPSTLPRHHTEGREHWCVPLKCSLGQALKPGMWQILDAPLPLPWQGSALTNVGARVGQAAAPGGITPRVELLLLILSLPLSPSLKPGCWTICCWSPLLCLSS